jgi:hypothetical protein
MSAFPCPKCKYGHMFRIVKDHGIPTHSEYMCIDDTHGTRLLEAPQGPGGWDGNTCPNYIERTTPEFEDPTVTVTTTSPGVNVHMSYDMAKGDTNE